ncbi:hypothetical protein L107_14987 [Cyanobium sp. Copco_Reservoir_LC18]|uniref:hypothetical protein n=1 Tax=Cyanobium sp. Copco_Reservoir_LC18 TaxID=1328305 RepID=UPI00135847E8|nr:hypothetical protein [Cyanobium sp. Copco_Reservoir_LC18]KAF0652205.1 hypothetical protein L107_14987 [Cyanobium sp. Copco_Reservoir_LC18]
MPSAARAESWTYQRLVEAFEQRGFHVVGSHPRCAERGLYGLDLRESRRIAVCPRGNLADTLLHEGWHGVQARWQREAEARVMARRDPATYFRLVDELCASAVPPPAVPPAPAFPASPAGAPQGQAVKRTGS